MFGDITVGWYSSQTPTCKQLGCKFRPDIGNDSQHHHSLGKKRHYEAISVQATRKDLLNLGKHSHIMEGRRQRYTPARLEERAAAKMGAAITVLE